MKICLVMPGSHYILYGGGTAGGAEWQMVLLARQLARQGHDVTFLTANPGGRSEEIVDGFRVVPAFADGATGPFLLFRVWRRLRMALHAADADVWIQRSASPLTGLMALDARKKRVAFVYMISSDSNVNGAYERQAGLRDRFLYVSGLRRAAGIVAQTAEQTRLLGERHGLKAVVIPSAVPAPPDPRPVVTPEQVFWAATFQPLKRPHLILDLARRAPDLNFAVAGTPWGKKDYGLQFEKHAKELPNVRLLGRLDRNGMDREYARSIALLSTSEHEGVSNTFLEAWRFGLPVVTLIADPDEVICRKGLGLHTDDFERVIEGLRRFRDDAGTRKNVAAAAQRHLALHDERAVAAQLAAWLETLLKSGGR